MKRIVTTLLLCAIPVPGVAQLVDPLAATTDPADRAVMVEAASAVASRPPDLARLDTVLAKLPRPTPLRGMVQAMRAAALGHRRDPAQAVAAVEDSLRLLPDDPRPKLIAVGIFTFSGSPQRAADLWMQASREAPNLARTSDRYVVSALVGRLTDIGDRVRADRLNARLGEIGYAAGLAPERSAAALARVRTDIASGRDEEAAQGVTGIGDPVDLAALYTDRRYEPLWPRIAQWAGPALEAQHRRHLDELRRDWEAANDLEAGAAYARRLAAVGAYPAVIALFLPNFERLAPGEAAVGAEFLAPIVARALTREGRSAEAVALIEKVTALVPENSGASLNMRGVHVTLAISEARWAEAIVQADAFLAEARPLGADVNRDAILNVEETRACALWQAGRQAEAERAAALLFLAEATVPGPAYDFELCRGRVDAARAFVVRRLADEGTRMWALAVLQPEGRPPDTPLARITAPVAEAVRASPDVRAAAEKVGRVLSQAVLGTLPPGFDPFRASRPVRTLAPGEI